MSFCFCNIGPIWLPVGQWTAVSASSRIESRNLNVWDTVSGVKCNEKSIVLLKH